MIYRRLDNSNYAAVNTKIPMSADVVEFYSLYNLYTVRIELGNHSKHHIDYIVNDWIECTKEEYIEALKKGCKIIKEKWETYFIK